jgi:hypothetical protein
MIESQYYPLIFFLLFIDDLWTRTTTDNEMMHAL